MIFMKRRRRQSVAQINSKPPRAYRTRVMAGLVPAIPINSATVPIYRDAGDERGHDA
jgi:hypothetical protein